MKLLTDVPFLLKVILISLILGFMLGVYAGEKVRENSSHRAPVGPSISLEHSFRGLTHRTST